MVRNTTSPYQTQQALRGAVSRLSPLNIAAIDLVFSHLARMTRAAACSSLKGAMHRPFQVTRRAQALHSPPRAQFPVRLAAMAPGQSSSKRVMDSRKIPVTVVTGFLGSGKTTLVRAPCPLAHAASQLALQGSQPHQGRHRSVTTSVN